MKPQKIILNRYKASPDHIDLGTYGSYGNEILSFCFKDGWEDATEVIAVFNSNLASPTPVVVDGDGTCKVPHEATDSVTSDGRITLVGYKQDAKIISLDIQFRTSSHSLTDGEPSQDPTPDVFEQYVNKVKDIVNTAIPPGGEPGQVLTKGEDKNIWTYPSGGGTGGGYTIGDGLKYDPESNILSVNTTSEIQKDNTLPITSAAVFTTVGNIEAVLGTI